VTCAASSHYHDGALAVAPMMDYTNQFLRFLLRRLTRRTTLYTEMVTANTIVHCKDEELSRFLGNNGDAEQPVVLQLGGADPDMLWRASEIAEPWGFTALNLNVGCPSDRVAGAGCFGAALMKHPQLVGECCAAMGGGVGGRLPITVKCRIGVVEDKRLATVADDEPTYAELARFIETVACVGGVRHFQLHARKAVLGGLSPAQNRQIPPLRYHLVHRLAADFPECSFSLNGGINTLGDAVHHLEGSRLSGVMVGRAIVAKPWEWATLDTTLYGEASDPALSRQQVLTEYCEYAREIEAHTPQKIRHLLIKPAVTLFAGEPHGKQFRREIDQIATSDKHAPAADVLLRAAEASLRKDTLEAPPGWIWHGVERMYYQPEGSSQSINRPEGSSPVIGDPIMGSPKGELPKDGASKSIAVDAS